MIRRILQTRFAVMMVYLLVIGLAGLAWGQSPLCPPGKVVLIPYVDGLVIPIVPKSNQCAADPTDSDGDRLADSWELAWFGDLSAVNGTVGSA